MTEDEEIDRLRDQLSFITKQCQHFEAENERLRGLCEEYAEMTGVILDVTLEQRQAFFDALEDKTNE